MKLASNQKKSRSRPKVAAASRNGATRAPARRRHWTLPKGSRGTTKTLRGSLPASSTGRGSPASVIR